MEVEGDRIATKEKAIEVLQKERDLIAGERELDESQFAKELLEALDVGIDAIMEQIGVTIHINIRDAEKEEVMKMFDKYGLIERILYGKKTEEKGFVTCVNQEKMHDKTADDIISRRALLKQIAIDSSGSEGYYGDEWKFIETIKNMPSAHSQNNIKKGEVMRIIIRFKSGFKLQITCDEFSIEKNPITGEITHYDIKGIKDNKLIFFRSEDVECIFREITTER